MEKVASAQGFTLVNAGYVYESELLARLPEFYPDVELRRLDAAAAPTQDFEELDPDEQDSAHALLEAAVPTLRPFDCHPEAQVRSRHLPAMFVAGSEPGVSTARSSRARRRPTRSSRGSREPAIAPGREPTTTLVLNFRNPLVRRLGLVRRGRSSPGPCRSSTSRGCSWPTSRWRRGSSPSCRRGSPA